VLINLKKWHPELLLVTNIGFGTMKNKENHHGLGYNTMEMGYYESGIIIRKLLAFRI